MNAHIPKMKNWKVGKLLLVSEGGLETQVNVILHEDPLVLTVQLQLLILSRKQVRQAVVVEVLLLASRLCAARDWLAYQTMAINKQGWWLAGRSCEEC